MKTYFVESNKFKEMFETMIANDRRSIKSIPKEHRKISNNIYYDGFIDKKPEDLMELFKITINNNQVLKETGIRKMISEKGDIIGIETSVEGMIKAHHYMLSYDYFKFCLKLCEEKKLEILYGEEGFILL